MSRGKPAGFKLCVGARRQFLAVCEAMMEEGTGRPDFIVVGGAEGGTDADPLEFADRIGAPLTEGLMTVHDALVGAGLRDGVRIGAGADLVKRLIQGAGYGNAARAMMFAIGCIRAQRCHTDTCPVGVAAQDPRRARALDVGDKAERVRRLQEATVGSALRIMASMGVTDPAQLRPRMLRRRVDPQSVRSGDGPYRTSPCPPGDPGKAIRGGLWSWPTVRYKRHGSAAAQHHHDSDDDNDDDDSTQAYVHEILFPSESGTHRCRREPGAPTKSFHPAPAKKS